MGLLACSSGATIGDGIVALAMVAMLWVFLR